MGEQEKNKPTYTVYTKGELKEKFENNTEGLILYLLEGEELKKDFKLVKRDIQKHMKVWLPEENKKILEKNKELEEEEKLEPLEMVYLQNEEDFTVEDLIVRRAFDFSKKEDGEFIVPTFDEREEEDYKMKFMGVNKVPPRGHFLFLDTKITSKPLGVYLMETFRADIPLKANDTRFEDKRRKRDNAREGKLYEDIKEFYYDYENEKYIHVIEKVDEKGKPMKSEESEELEKRKEAISYINSVLYGMVRKYRLLINEKYEWFLKETEGVNTVKQYQAIFREYKLILQLFIYILPVKLLLAHLDDEEYKFLLKYAKGLMNKVKEKEEELLKLLESTGGEDFNFSKDEGKEKYIKLYNQLGDKRKVGFLKYLYSFIESRREYKKDNPLITQGYLVKKDSEGWGLRLIPNLATLEKRDFFTIHQWSKDKEEEFKQKVLAKHNKELAKEKSKPRVIRLLEKGNSSSLSHIVHHLKNNKEVEARNIFNKAIKDIKHNGEEKELFKELIIYLNKIAK